MKVPFHTFIGPILKRNSKKIKQTCTAKIFCVSHVYIPCLALAGMLLSLVDLYRIIKCGPVLPAYLTKDRKSGVVKAEVERDLKLISLVISFEYYLLLFAGYFSTNAALFLPFLFLYALIGSLEVFNFVVRLLCTPCPAIETTSRSKNLFMTLLVIFNWTSVLCYFYKIICRCDL